MSYYILEIGTFRVEILMALSVVLVYCLEDNFDGLIYSVRYIRSLTKFKNRYSCESLFALGSRILSMLYQTPHSSCYIAQSIGTKMRFSLYVLMATIVNSMGRYSIGLAVMSYVTHSNSLQGYSFWFVFFFFV